MPAFMLLASNIDSLELQLEKANEVDKIDILTQLSKEYWTISPSKGIFYSNEAIKLADQYNSPEKKAKALLYGGVNAWFMGGYDDAIEYYQKSLTIAREIQNNRLCAYNLNNLGMVNTYLKNYEKAIENYSESSLIMEEMGDKIEYAKIQNNIAELNMLLGNLDQALQQHLSTLQIIEDSDEQVFLIWLYNDIGIVYFKKGQYEKALQYFYQSLDLCNKMDNTIGKLKTLNHLGEVYLQQKEYEKARECFFNGIEYSKATEAKEIKNDIYKNISQYYSAIDNYQKSLEYYILHKQLSDSIINDNKIRTIIEMQSRYELEGTENENRILRNNIEINELTIKKNKIAVYFLFISLFLTSLLILLIQNRFMIGKRKNKELNEKNTLINEQKNQLTNTLAELQELNKLLQTQKEEIQNSKEELEITNKRLAETNATKDKFFSIIAHDLKSPFSSMLGFSEILDEEFDNYEMEEKKKWIKMIHHGLQDTSKLLENLLQWAQSQRGTIDFDPKSINLYTVSKESYELLYNLAGDKSIKLINSIPENIILQADANMISAIIRNLLSNAIKFTSYGGVIKLNANLTSDNQFVKIVVEDNGFGISEEMQTKLFNIVEHVSTLGTKNEKGTGLGLILCKEFVEKHHGKIWVESELGKGSSFYFTIPYSQ